MHQQYPEAQQTLLLDQPTQAPILTGADALEKINEWDDLPETRRRDLASAVRSAAKLAGQPPESLVLNPASLRQTLLQHSAATLGLSDSRSKAIRSGLNFVMRRLGVVAAKDTPLSPVWAALLDPLDRFQRASLTALARYCSTAGIDPDQTDDAVLHDYIAFLTSRTLEQKPRKKAGLARAALHRALGSNAPLKRLGADDQFILPIDDFPESFGADLKLFADRMGHTGLVDPFSFTNDLNPTRHPFGRNIATRPLRKSSVENRVAHCRWAASALVAKGVPASDITNLTMLVQPLENARTILRFVHQRAGEKPSAQGMHIGNVLRIIARHHARLPEAEVRQIAEWAGIVTIKYPGMTEKNQKTMRAIIQPDRLAALDAVPDALMNVADKLLAKQMCKQAATLAWQALAIGFLTRCPLRLDDIVSLRLDQHLQRPDPRRPDFSHVVIPAEQAKTAREICMPISKTLMALLHRWLHVFRPLIAQAGNQFLFASTNRPGKPVTPQWFRNTIKNHTAERVGVMLTPHQFRHLAAFRFLKEFPGEYETVRQLLGHASTTITTKHYAGVEVDVAARRFDELVLGSASKTSPTARAKPGRPKLKPKPRGPKGKGR